MNKTSISIVMICITVVIWVFSLAVSYDYGARYGCRYGAYRGYDIGVEAGLRIAAKKQGSPLLGLPGKRIISRQLERQKTAAAKIDAIKINAIKINAKNQRNPLIGLPRKRVEPFQ